MLMCMYQTEQALTSINTRVLSSLPLISSIYTYKHSHTKENSSPIQTILNGSNYITWSQAMRSYLKGKRLWRYVNGDFTIPTKEKDETDSKFKDRIEEWDVKNHQAITFFRNSSVSKINLQFGNYDTAKEIWDLLASRYTTSDLSHQYQIMNFLSQIQSFWDQLTLSEPKWLHTEDATLYHTYRDQQRLIQFLMALTQDFEPVRAALLHRVPLPSLESSVTELISEETRLGIGKINSMTDTVLAVPPVSTSDKPFCRFCRQSGHVTKDCVALRNHTCQHCHQKGHYSIQFCKKKPSFHANKFTRSSAAATSESTSENAPTTSTSELESLLKQVLSKTSSPSTAFSVTSGTSYVILVLILSSPLLVVMYRILRQDRLLGQGVDAEGCLSSLPFIFQNHHLLIWLLLFPLQPAYGILG
ncbi:hypothetical protein DCAR_0832108 [Daucus carota subsp. sativus]|uniref:Retrotransposon Copia-like N-terminal domain-containing protein n=1 Tax=Daucus carota subsp. sativus TaxID=79200 RepID=A0AAF0XSP2_DAUCS|nr:hypothetical protein DCAR_0832108 [Daucus carota subsp. sativus]